MADDFKSSCEINQMANCIQVTRCIDECNCEPLTVWVYYLSEAGSKVYTSPPCFVVAIGNKDGYGYLDNGIWQAEMTACGIPEQIKIKVINYLYGHQPIPKNEE